MTRYLLILLLTASCILPAEIPVPDSDPLSKQIVEEKKTERLPLPAGGVVRLKNSFGDLDIDAWDESSVEITTVKTSHDYLFPSERDELKAQMERVTIKAERQGNDVMITTYAPRQDTFSFRSGADFLKLNGMKFGIEYHISVPRNARLVIDHGSGNVNVDGVQGDIEARARRGQITLHLPEDAMYNIDAKSTYGNINSDFPGQRHRKWIGQKAFEEGPGPAHSLKLRVGYGDIVLLRIRVPKSPDSNPGKPGGGGL